ncbi:hypothetical protein UlMin_020888 [Ulmus minor]
MHPHLSHSLLLIFILIGISIHFPTSLRADDERYTNCNRNFTCGNIQDIGYPFWGVNLRSEYCGRPEFELNCSGEEPQITIGSLNHRVLGMNQDSYILMVARTDYLENLCPRHFFNDSLGTGGLFAYTADSQVASLYYKCVSIIPTATQNRFTCNINETNSVNYFATENIIRGQNNISPGLNSTTLGSCAEIVTVRATDSAVADFETALTRSTASTSDMVDALKAGYDVKWDASNSMCERCKSSGGQCGFNSTTPAFSCFCKDTAYPLNCNDEPNSSSASNSGRSSSKLGRIIAIAGAVSAIIIIFCSMIVCHYKRECVLSIIARVFRKDTSKEFDVEAFIRNYESISTKRYSYARVKKMTNSFAEKIGSGGFGAVYKGKLPDGHPVAVKILKNSKGDGEEFINEVASIGRTSHVNIVTLLGFCYERNKRALIYEYMPNGSLEKFIFKQGSSVDANCSLEWETLYRIAVGIARGLQYLHQGCNTRILHFDIKPQNILLDDDFCPKISDFGLAKLWLKKESIMSMVGARGTFGYIAPEVVSRNFGGVSHKSDVYSYGMLALEMVGGRKNFDSTVSRTSEIYYPNRIYKDMELGNQASILAVTAEEEKEIIRKMVLVSFWCIQTNPSDRPSMSKVVEMLEGSLESLEIPPKPYLFSPTRSP